MYKTFQDYRAAWEAAFTVDPLVPLNVDIELASLCNAKCPFCFFGEADWNELMDQKAADGKPKKRFMPTEMAIRIIDEAAAIGVPALKFNWRGESTLHPDYSLILKYAASWMTQTNQDGRRFVVRNHEIGKYPAPRVGIKDAEWSNAFHELLVNTNANCKDHAIDGLMAATKCMISLDSCVPETYEKMRVNLRLEAALATARKLIEREHPNLWIRRVITKANADEPFKANVDRLLGGKGYKVSEHYCIDRGDNSHAANNPAQYDRTFCGYPSQRIMVASDGICYPCCVDTDGVMPMGDANKQTLLEIWNGEPFKKLREELRRNEFCSKACNGCESWLAYKAPQRENVQDRAL